MEPHTVVAWWDPDEAKLNLWAPSQAPRNIQAEVAHVLDLNIKQVRVREVFTGGDFGSRVKVSDVESLASLAAIRTGQPVRIALSREDEFRYTKSRYPATVALAIGADAAGLIRSYDAAIEIDIGAYMHGGAGDFKFIGPALASLYSPLAVDITTTAVYTTKRHPGSFRGAGLPQATFARESAIDELAEGLGVDPLSLRLQNLDMALEGSHAWRIDNARLRACLTEAARRIDWSEKDARLQSGYGVGLAVSVGVTGVGEASASALVELHSDGRVVLKTGLSDAGTGQKTIAAQIAAETLGVDLSDVEVVTADTALTPSDPGAGSSKGTYISGNAVRLAAKAVADEIAATAGGKFAVDPGDVLLSDGHASSGEQSIPVADLVELSDLSEDGMLALRGTFYGGHKSSEQDLSDVYAYCAQAALVHVDPQLGAVRVERIVCVLDGGRIVNPLIAKGQVEGGIVMGLGASLG
jgi:CO/xanthine dehydrogenase Mo-binding subunit